MRESRTLRAMWRALETGPRHLLNGHEEGNLGYKPRRCLRAAAPVLDPTGIDFRTQKSLRPGGFVNAALLRGWLMRLSAISFRARGRG